MSKKCSRLKKAECSLKEDCQWIVRKGCSKKMKVLYY